MSRDEHKYFFIWMRVGDYTQFRLPFCFATRRDAMLVGKRLDYLSSYTTCKIASATLRDVPLMLSERVEHFLHSDITSIHARLLGLSVDANLRIQEWVLPEWYTTAGDLLATVQPDDFEPASNTDGE